MIEISEGIKMALLDENTRRRKVMASPVLRTIDDNELNFTYAQIKALATGDPRLLEAATEGAALIPDNSLPDPNLNQKDKTIHFRQAKATPEDIQNLRDFLERLEHYEEEGIDNDEDFALDIMGRFESLSGWRRVVEGYQVLIEGACDPALDYLEFKPEIKAKLEN